MSKPVHLCDYASQPNIHIWCSGKWTTPAWIQLSDEVIPHDVYVDDEGDLYAFDTERVTCEKCKEKVA